MLRGGVVEEFYNGFAQRARDLAEKADPITRRRLLDLAKRYDLKGKGSSYGRTPATRATPPTMLFSGSSEAGTSVFSVGRPWPSIGSTLVLFRERREPLDRLRITDGGCQPSAPLSLSEQSGLLVFHAASNPLAPRRLRRRQWRRLSRPSARP